MVAATIKEYVDTYKKSIANTDIFDVNIWWDRISRDRFVKYDSWEEQMKAYRSFSIRKGIVTNAVAAKFDPYEGNAELAELLKGQNGFFGCMVLTPDICFKDNGSGYILGMKDKGFIAARMFPKTFMHSMSDYATGKLLKILEENHIPLMLWHTQVSFDEMDRICSDYPDLIVILEGHDRKYLYHARDYTALLLKHKNFYIETHNIVLFREYETLADICGCDNLLYGSYFPYITPHFSMHQIVAAEITEKQKKDIFYENSKRVFPILKEVTK